MVIVILLFNLPWPLCRSDGRKMYSERTIQTRWFCFPLPSGRAESHDCTKIVDLNLASTGLAGRFGISSAVREIGGIRCFRHIGAVAMTPSAL